MTLVRNRFSIVLNVFMALNNSSEQSKGKDVGRKSAEAKFEGNIPHLFAVTGGKPQSRWATGSKTFRLLGHCQISCLVSFWQHRQCVRNRKLISVLQEHIRYIGMKICLKIIINSECALHTQLRYASFFFSIIPCIALFSVYSLYGYIPQWF